MRDRRTRSGRISCCSPCEGTHHLRLRDEYNRLFRFNASRFLAPSAAAADAQQRMEQARRKLGRLGTSQLDLYDQRGKRPLPPAYLARGFYYGLLCLLQGPGPALLEREFRCHQP